MHCPFCRHTDSRVVDSPRRPTTARRSAGAGSARSAAGASPPSRRRSLTVVKRSGATEPFSRDKVARRRPQGLPGPPGQRGRPGAARPSGSRRASGPQGSAEIDAHEVGLAILGPLRELDEVAYLRFASVYRAFESLEDFEAEIALLRAEREATGVEPAPAAGRRTRRAEHAQHDRSTPAPPTQPARTSRTGALSVPPRDTSTRAEPRSGRPAMTETTGARRRGTQGARKQGPDDRAGLHHRRRAPLRRGHLGAPRRRPDQLEDRRDVFEQRGVEFPDFWSVNASTIVTTKYFRGAVGTDAREWSLQQLIDRVVLTYTQGRRGARLLRHRPPTPRSSSTS